MTQTISLNELTEVIRRATEPISDNPPSNWLVGLKHIETSLCGNVRSHVFHAHTYHAATFWSVLLNVMLEGLLPCYLITISQKSGKVTIRLTEKVEQS